MQKLHSRWLLRLTALALATGLLGAARPRAAAQPVQDWPEIAAELVAGGLEAPVAIAHAGDGSGWLFVVEQPGRIQIVEDQAVAGVFLDITDRVLFGGEQGLLGLAFPPGYGAGKDHFYVYYTNDEGDNQLSRFSLGQDADTADPDSEELILLLEHPGRSNHNGGQIAFGPDGYLYIGPGDGGGGGDPDQNAQDPSSLLGKILRIDVEFENTEPTPIPPTEPAPTPGPDDRPLYFPLLVKGEGTPASPADDPYRIPADNPFVDEPGYRDEIWALGLRNPWRFSFDRETGDLFIGDVGQGTKEEINFQPADSGGGENYGWPILEGDECYAVDTCDDDGLVYPVAVYPTHVNGACAVTGGYVYRGEDFPDMQGIYFFADYCNGIISGLQPEGNGWIDQELTDTTYGITTFGEDEAGELYFADVDGGDIYRVVEATADR
jgi:glucose/arabinose dehydrogenase